MNVFNEKNQRHGYWEEYFSDDTLWYKGNYMNGSLYCKGDYNYDEYLGYWEWYNIDGELVFKEFYL
jgi:hypothetical protein